MQSTHSINSRVSSQASLSEDWSEHVLRKKYRDPMKLKQYLDNTYGEEHYKVTVKGDRWILALPNPLVEGEIERLEEQIQNHY